MPAHIELEYRLYLDCGLLARGFARARRSACGHDWLIALSCKGRGLCPSCNARRMAEVAAHLVGHVLPRLPVRQWMLSVPKRLRYHLERDTGLAGRVLRVFLRAVESTLRGPEMAAGGRMGAVTFVRRFGSALNPHYHCCALDNPGHDRCGQPRLHPGTADALTALIPPLRLHRRHYHGVLAPHAEWRARAVPAGGENGPLNYLSIDTMGIAPRLN